jgi:hypothetical protein
MAFGTSSKIFSAFVTDVMNNTSALDMNADSLKFALFGNSGTPDQTAAAASTGYNTGQWTTGNETSNGGWSAGGLVPANVTSSFTSNVYKLDADDVANGAAATIADTRGGLFYDDTITTPVADQGICYLSFGGQQTVTAGVLTVVFNASGILTLTL